MANESTASTGSATTTASATTTPATAGAKTASTAVVNTDSKTKTAISSVTQLAGLGAGLYFAYKKGKGAWGYIGLGLAGLIVGSIVGGLVAGVVEKK